MAFSLRTLVVTTTLFIVSEYASPVSSRSPFLQNEIVFPFVSEKEEKPCKTRSGEDGFCRNIEDCGSALASITTEHPTICYFEKNLPVVCCADEDDVIPEATEEPEPDISTRDPFETRLEEDCGKRPETQTNSHFNKTLDLRKLEDDGGKESSAISWPWMAAVTKFSLVGTSRFICGGSLINPRFILTAAHCFDDADGNLQPSRYEVLVGLHARDEGIPYGVEKIMIHKDYSSRKGYNDIALLKLSEDVDYSDQVGAVCLPVENALESKKLNGRLATITGFGKTLLGGRSSFPLREVKVPIVSNQACNQSFVRKEPSRFNRGIVDSQICAGLPTAAKDPCQGESGGPLVVKDEDGRWHVIGVLSYGIGCAQPALPGVYTRVAPFLDWIREHGKTTPTAHLRELYRNFIVQRSRKQKERFTNHESLVNHR